MSIINVQCLDQTLTITNAPEIASGGVNEDQVTFTFCDQWTGFTKTAVFYRDEQNVYNMLLDSNDSCSIPAEVLATDGVFYFGAFGIKDNTTRTSEVLRYTVKQGAITSGSTPPEPTPDIYQQILSQYNTMTAQYSEIIADLNELPYVDYVDGESITPIAPIISDSGTSLSKTWSSSKISGKFNDIVKTGKVLWEGNKTITGETTTISVPGINDYSVVMIDGNLYGNYTGHLRRESTETTDLRHFTLYSEDYSILTGEKLQIVCASDNTASKAGLTLRVNSGAVTTAAEYVNTMTIRKIVGVA